MREQTNNPIKFVTNSLPPVAVTLNVIEYKPATAVSRVTDMQATEVSLIVGHNG